MKTRMCLLAALLATLTACFSGLNSKAPAQQRYVLQPAAGAAAAGAPAAAARASAAAPAAASVKVLRASGAPGLESEGIAVLRPGARLDYYSNARWAVAAPSALQALVVESLRNAGRFASVESDSGPFAAQYVMSLELEHFEAVYGADGPPTVQVALVCSLGRGSDRSVLVSFTARSAVTAQADRMQAVMAAFEQATAEALAQVAANAVPP